LEEANSAKSWEHIRLLLLEGILDGSAMSKVKKRGRGSSTIIAGAALLFATLSIVGCSWVFGKVADSLTQEGIRGFSGLVVDTSLLLAKAESSGDSPQRIVIAFNGSRYDPRSYGWASSRHKSSELPFKRAYNIDLRINSIRGQPVTIAVRIDLPADAQSSRIPVQVVSFPDPNQELPLVKIEEVFVRENRSRIAQHWFEYTNDDWQPVAKK